MKGPQSRSIACSLSGSFLSLLAYTSPANAEVQLINPLPDLSLSENDAQVRLNISEVFSLSDQFGTLVRFETNAPMQESGFFVELFDRSGSATVITPLSAANFLSYVNEESYDNSIVHRSVSGFVIQGGGFRSPLVAADQPGSNPTAIVTRDPLPNEPGNLNLRGTLAMAKLGNQPDSATSQWFFNLSNNSFLDTDNGGFTVFGRVLGEGMTVIDTIAATPTYNATTYYSNAALGDLPLWRVNQDNIVRPDDFVQIESVTQLTSDDPLLTYTVTSSDSSLASAVVEPDGTLLIVQSDTAGTAQISLTATSLIDGTAQSTSFFVATRGFIPPLGGIPTVPPVITRIGFYGNSQFFIEFEPGGLGYKIVTSPTLDFRETTDVVPTFQPSFPGANRFEFNVMGPQGFFRVEKR